MMKRISLILILIVIGFGQLLADDITLTINAPATAIKGAHVQLQYILRGGNADDIKLDGTIKGFDLIYGPSTAFSQSTSYINGKMTSDSYTAFTYTLLATEEGTFTLPSATATVGGKKYTSKTFTIKVIPPDKNSQQTRPGQQPQAIVSSSTGKVDPKDAFVEAHFSKTKVCEQEAVMVTFRLYTKLDIRGVEKVQFPEFEGFMVEDVELPPNRQLRMDRYKGQNYVIMDVKKSLLFPQRSGKLTIPAGTMDLIFEVKSGQKVQHFGQSFDVMTESRAVLKTSPVTIDVSALPIENKPLNFSGAVGNFTFTPTLSSDHVKANDAITIKLDISGTGNMKLIKNPDIKFPPDFEVYDPKVDNKTKITENGLTGTRSVEYMVIPRSPGNFTIAPIEFNYFDPKTREYKTLTSPEYKIKVDIDPNAGKNNSATSYNQTQVKVDTDIRYLKLGEYKFGNADNFFFGKLSYLLFYIIPFILFITLAVIYRKQIKANANVTLMRTKRANKVAIKRLKLANKYLQAHNKDSFYEEVLRATWGYLSDKLTIPVADLSRENIEIELARYGASEELVKQFISVLDTCEFARYAPSADTDKAMDKLYNEAVDAIGSMEKGEKINKL